MNKILNIFLLLSLLTFSLQQQKYSLAIYGDNGQISYWFKNQLVSKDKSLIEPFYKNILSQESYKLAPFQCQVSHNKTLTDLVESEGFENFNHLNSNEQVREMIRSADGVVFMGDVIYPETKRLYGGQPGNMTLQHESKWVERLKCGWNLFFEALGRIGLAKLSKQKNKSFLKANPAAAEKNFVVLDEKVEILAGNHSQDVDLFVEEEIVSSVPKKPLTLRHAELEYSVAKESFENTEKLFTESPRLITIEFRDFDVQFLDFNSANIFCLAKDNEKDFNACAFAPKFTPFAQARAYGWKLVQYLNKLKIQTDEDAKETRRVWRVMRAHHPPLNTEDGDSDFYFNPIYVDNGKQADFQVNLWEIMRERKVNVFLGSHTHQAQVLALPYNYAFKAVNAGCEGKPAWGCYAVNPKDNSFAVKPQLQKKCQNELEYQLPINAVHDLDNDLLYVFVFGNSGRSLDALKEGRNSVGVLLWARAQEYENKKLGYGFALAEFTAEMLSVHFYEALPDEEASLVRAATFEVYEAPLPDFAKVASYIDSKVCPAPEKKK